MRHLNWEDATIDPDMFRLYRNQSPGDNRHPMSRPEIVASEERVLQWADALLRWIRHTEWPEGLADRIDLFMAHEGPNPYRSLPADADTPVQVERYVLTKTDLETNQFLMELLRAAWERRCWQTHYGERKSPFDDARPPIS